MNGSYLHAYYAGPHRHNRLDFVYYVCISPIVLLGLDNRPYILSYPNASVRLSV